jgi:hypothetical protein
VSNSAAGRQLAHDALGPGSLSSPRGEFADSCLLQHGARTRRERQREIHHFIIMLLRIRLTTDVPGRGRWVGWAARLAACAALRTQTGGC